MYQCIHLRVASGIILLFFFRVSCGATTFSATPVPLSPINFLMASENQSCFQNGRLSHSPTSQVYDWAATATPTLGAPDVKAAILQGPNKIGINLSSIFFFQ